MYDALGDFDAAVKEIKLAATLDPSNPNNYYTLYALYKRKRCMQNSVKFYSMLSKKMLTILWDVSSLLISSKRRSIGQTLFGNIRWLSAWPRV